MEPFILSAISLKESRNKEKNIYTYFHRGRIIELPTRWLHFLSHEPRYSLKTIRNYAHGLYDLLKWLVAFQIYQTDCLDSILKVATRADLQQWIINRKATGIKASTLRNREVPVKLFFEWLATNDGGKVRHVEEIPYKTGKLISAAPEKNAPHYLTVEDIIRLLNGYYNESERCLIHFLYDTGLRISEAVTITNADLPDERSFPDGLKYYPLYVSGAKGRGGNPKPRISLISSPLLARIRRNHLSKEYRFSPFFSNDETKPVFLSVNGRPLAQRNVNRQMKCSAARADMDPTFISPHAMRRSAAFAILISELGNDYLERMLVVQHLFGHTNVRSTEIYARIPPAVLAKLNSDRVANDKYEEAKRIYSATFLPPKAHIERRGHYR
jgi:integrase/recombinase XerC